MFCPRCNSKQGDEVKFCTICGANLHAVRQAVDTTETAEKFDWSDTWVADIFLSGQAQKRRKEEMERRRGITPEIKRYKEIKAGVIVSSLGMALSIFLYFFMQGIVATVSPDEAEILSRIWIAGVIPFFLGIALIVNGAVVSKRLVEIANREAQKGPKSFEEGGNPPALRSADTSEFIDSPFSVTEQTTRHLRSSERK
ncbi:MAG TPA: zinc ribbon domain-containing protein [Pyrinomonadaceae bacterium]|nr:zinc ribbon domain-containing protein [Pyrinomonadaceae bacterium]